MTNPAPAADELPKQYDHTAAQRALVQILGRPRLLQQRSARRTIGCHCWLVQRYPTRVPCPRLCVGMRVIKNPSPSSSRRRTSPAPCTSATPSTTRCKTSSSASNGCRATTPCGCPAPITPASPRRPSSSGGCEEEEKLDRHKLGREGLGRAHLAMERQIRSPHSRAAPPDGLQLRLAAHAVHARRNVRRAVRAHVLQDVQRRPDLPRQAARELGHVPANRRRRRRSLSRNGEGTLLAHPLSGDRSASPASRRIVTIATTRPETMLGDTAVAVHPDPAAALDKVEARAARKARRRAGERKSRHSKTDRRSWPSAAQTMLPQLAQAPRHGQRRPQADAAAGQPRNSAHRRRMGQARTRLRLRENHAGPRRKRLSSLAAPQRNRRDQHHEPRRHAQRQRAGKIPRPENAHQGPRGRRRRSDRSSVCTIPKPIAKIAKSISPTPTARKTPIEPYLADQWFVRMGDNPTAHRASPKNAWTLSLHPLPRETAGREVCGKIKITPPATPNPTSTGSAKNATGASAANSGGGIEFRCGSSTRSCGIDKDFTDEVEVLLTPIGHG